ncbi:head GIN domain-containing protein [soil metagenome]
MRYLTIMALLPLAACSMSFDDHDADGKGVASTGSGTARSYAVADFTGVDLRGSDDVDVRVGAAFSVRAEGSAKDLDRLVIEKVGDTLRVGRKHGSFNWGWQHGDEVKIFVTMPSIASASISGSGNLGIDKVAAAKFEASTAGSGDISIGSLAADDADFSVAGSGGIAAAAGLAKRLTISIAGSGDVDAARLKASSADVSIAGSGNASADVTGPAQVSIIGSGDADLGAAAKCTTSKVGSGEVKCGG